MRVAGRVMLEGDATWSRVSPFGDGEQAAPGEIRNRHGHLAARAHRQPDRQMKSRTGHSERVRGPRAAPGSKGERMNDPPVEFIWHDGPVPAGLPVTQVYGGLLCRSAAGS